jgi:hypothetical protein
MKREPPTSYEFARSLISSRTTSVDDRELAGAAAAHEVSEQLYVALSHWVGIEGSFALFHRAMSSARLDHPALRCILLNARSDLLMEGVGDAVHLHGESTVVESLATLLAGVIDLLGRLIGDDMAATLVEQATQSRPDHRPTGGRRTSA